MEETSGCMTSKQAAEYLHISENHLRQLRFHHKGPYYSKPSPRTIIYTKEDIDAWLAESRQK